MNQKHILRYLALLILGVSVFVLVSFVQFDNNQENAKIHLDFLKFDNATAQTLSQNSKIKAYFNYNSNSTYTDPYRQISRKGDNLEKIIIDQIASATQSIDLAVEEVNLPGIAQALAERYKAGIQVRWITEHDYVKPWGTLTTDKVADLDPDDQDLWAEWDELIDLDKDGNLSPDEVDAREIYTIFNNNGIPWIDDTADGSKGSDLMHHKFIVIDGQKVITGSVNFTLSGIHGDFDEPNSFGNAEHLVVIDSPDLANLYTQEFNLMWGDGPGGQTNSQFGLKKPDRGTQTIQVGDAQVQIHFSPSSAGVPYSQTSGGMVATALSQAQKSIDLAQFVFSDQNLTNLLGRLYQEQNIQLRGVFHQTFATQKYSSTLDMWGLKLADSQCKLYPELYPWPKPAIQIGIPRLGQTDKLHHKFAILDQETVITGSQNWSNAGNRENDENVLVIRSPIVAAQFTQEMERLLQSTTFGPPSSLQQQAADTQNRCGDLTAPTLPPTP
jgi:phosphatidylserine/phosphatidylglycerophosphate/cardiolipin synthase-like enzyme